MPDFDLSLANVNDLLTIAINTTGLTEFANVGGQALKFAHGQIEPNLEDIDC